MERKNISQLKCRKVCLTSPKFPGQDMTIVFLLSTSYYLLSLRRVEICPGLPEEWWSNLCPELGSPSPPLSVCEPPPWWWVLGPGLEGGQGGLLLLLHLKQNLSVPSSVIFRIKEESPTFSFISAPDIIWWRRRTVLLYYCRPLKRNSE